MPADVPRQVFRSSPPSYVIGWVVTIVFALLGLGFVVGGPSRRAWVWPEIIGIGALSVAAGLALAGIRVAQFVRRGRSN